jgi:predicted DCC family thiol-disulfide oxidoreductase YuxK
MSTHYLLYDGECPLCSRYVRMTRLQKTLPGFSLLDARNYSDLVAEHRSRGSDVNDGMILYVDGATYHGADALNRIIALLSTPSTILNRLNAVAFRSKTVSRVVYPTLVLGRNTLLKLLGKSGID